MVGHCGHTVNRKRAQRLMRTMGLSGMAPGPNTSRAHPQNKMYPYLLRGKAIVRPNQVWSTDITYIRLTRGFVYLADICIGNNKNIESRFKTPKINLVGLTRFFNSSCAGFPRMPLSPQAIFSGNSAVIPQSL
jgi:hypothetical protein